MTILGSIVLAAALAAPSQAQRNAPKAAPEPPKAEQNSPAEPSEGASGGPCGTIAVSSAQPMLRGGVYSASKTLDISFKMVLGEVEEGAHLVTFRVFTPKGHLYQEIRVQHRRHPEGRRNAILSASFPVAGTAIHTNSIYGVWSVVPHLDDSPEPCAAATAFKISQ